MDQHIMVCSSDVAAFVDALETISYPPKTQRENVAKADRGSDEGPTDDSSMIKSDVKGVTKRFRVNPKQQKKIIEDLFEKQKAVITERSFMNFKGTKRFKSDVWSWFGDIKLLISRCEAKKLNISFYIKYCGGEQMILSKMFVACFKCMALFIHDSQKSGTSTLRSHMRVCSRPKSKRNRHSPTIIFFPNKPNEDMRETVVSDSEKLSIQNSILNFFLSNQSKFDITENTEFQKLLQLCILIGATYGDVNIDSMLCPQEKISEFLLNDMYVIDMNKFCTEFQHIHGASYFINVWEDESKLSYISLICYYSTTTGELRSVILHTDEFSFKSKLAKDAKDWFVSFIVSQPVVPLKRIILTDTQSNMVTAFEDEYCIKCAVQTLCSFLNKVFKNIPTCEIAKNNYVQLINSSLELVTYLEKHSFWHKLPKKQDTSITYWKYVVDLLKSMEKLYESISSFLNEKGNVNLLFFEKKSFTEIVNFFQLFESALYELSITSEPTMNIYLPWIIKLRKHCLTSDRDSAILLYFKKELCFELNEQITKSVSVYHRIATLLDPRFKKMIFLPREDHIAACIKIKSLVKECIEAPLMEYSPVCNIKSKLEEKEKFRLSPPADELINERNAHKEVDQYLFEPFQLVNQERDSKQKKFNPLKYWAKNCSKYPHLSKIAMWILSCPVSCIKSEEPVLYKNWFVNHCGIHLSPEHVNKTLFVKSFRNL